MVVPFTARSGRKVSSRLGSAQAGARSSGNSRYVRLEIEELEGRCLLDANPATTAVAPDNLSTANTLLQAPKGNPQVVFMGDSITQFFAYGAGASVWNSQIAPMNAADYGVAGNTTGNVLWQIQNGQLSGIQPTVVVLMIGVNNLQQGQTPFETAEGVAADVEAIEMAQPQAHVLVLGILPAYASPYNPMRVEIAETNLMISALGGTPNVTYLNFGSDFLLSNGMYNSALTIDYCHPSAQGYSVEANAIVPVIQHLLAEGPIPGASPAYGVPSSFSGANGYGYPEGFSSADPYAYPYADPFAYPTPPATSTPTPTSTNTSSSSTQSSGSQSASIANVLQNVANVQNSSTTPAPVYSGTTPTVSSTTQQPSSLVSGAPTQADLSSSPGQPFVYYDQDGNPLIS